MPIYAQVTRTQGKPAEVEIHPTPPPDWDDSEDVELEWLARGASELARSSHRDIDKAKADACRKKLLSEMRLPN